MATGGIPTLEGVRYELLAVLFHVPALLKGEIREIRYQLPVVATTQTDAALSQVYLDDFSVTDGAGRNGFWQAKQNTTNSNWTVNALAREGVLLQMWQQHESQPTASLGFVSNIPATGLSQLAEAAHRHTSAKEFVRNLSNGLRKDLAKIQQHLAVTSAQIHAMLEVVDCQLLTEEVIIARARDFAADRYGDPSKFRLVVRDYFERNPSRPISGDMLQAELDAEGLFRLPPNLAEDTVTLCFRASGDLRNHASLIAGVHIPREETETIVAWIDSLGSGKGVAALLDVAGSGKSVIMHDVLIALEHRHIPVLAIKADRLSATSGPNALAKDAFRLPDEPESILAAAARKHGRAVLLFDQLDALSMTFSRDQGMLDLAMSVISRAATIDGVAVVFSCRAFDRHYDPKIHQLSAAHEVAIKPLTQDQIEPVLKAIGIEWEKLTQQEHVLLQQPQHLDLFARVIQENRRRGTVRRHAATVQDLYNMLWELVVATPPLGAAESGAIDKAIQTMAEAVEHSQMLAQPVTILDSCPAVRRYLSSAGILRHEGSTISFFHQSFFDYVLARRFATREDSLVGYLRRSEQGLFQRPIVVHVLTYLRSLNPRKCLAELEQLLRNSRKAPIRYHLRHLAFAWFGQQAQLTDSEKSLGIKYLRTTAATTDFLLGCRGNPDWFDALQEELQSLLDGDDATLTATIRFLDSVQESRAAAVYGMLLPRIASFAKVRKGAEWCIMHHKEWLSQEAGRCLVWLYEYNSQPWHSLDYVLVSVAKANAALGRQVLEVVLNRLRTEWVDSTCASEAYSKYMTDIFPRQLHGVAQIMKACSSQTPSDYLSLVIPWISVVAEDVRPRSAGAMISFSTFRTGFAEGGGEAELEPAKALLQGIRTALIAIARSAHDLFLNWADDIRHSKVEVLHQLLMEAVIAEPRSYAGWACAYLLEGGARLQIGSHGECCRCSGQLIGAIFPHLSRSQRHGLERTILSHFPSWERDENGKDKYAGISQLELLWDVPRPLLGPHARTAIARLKRKFKGWQFREKPDYSLPKVESPVPQHKASTMSPGAWLRFMRQFDDTTAWGRERRSIEGGIVELSRHFEDEVSKHPAKFAPMFNMLDSRVSSEYWASLLTGLAKSELGTGRLYRIALALNSRRPNDPVIERAIYETVEKRIKDPVPDDMLEALRQAALNSADPCPETEAPKNAADFAAGDPYARGFNSVRGRAIRVYVIIASRGGAREAARLIETIAKAASDPSSAVRACLVAMLPGLMRSHPDTVQQAFATALESRPELLETQPTHEFIYWSLGRHHKRMLPLLKRMIVSTVPDTHIAAGRLVTLAWLQNPAIGASYERCIGGDAPLRQGVATVLSRNVDDAKLRPVCLRELQRLLNDKDDTVAHSIARVFEYLPPPNPGIKQFIRKYISSLSIAASPDAVARYGTRIQPSDGQFAVEIGERVLNRFGPSALDPSQRTGLLDDDLVNISMAAYRMETRPNLKRRAMDLFERALKMGSYFAKQALDRVDQ